MTENEQPNEPTESELIRVRREKLARIVALGYDPQTAGGLLVALPAEHGAVIEAEFTSRRLFLRRVGTVEEGSGVLVV